jgi:hypothetical protein
MIKPDISDSEVFTAIKKALKVRDEGRRFFETASHDPVASLVDGTRASTKDARKKAIPSIILRTIFLFVCRP